MIFYVAALFHLGLWHAIVVVCAETNGAAYSNLVGELKKCDDATSNSADLVRAVRHSLYTQYAQLLYTLDIFAERFSEPRRNDTHVESPNAGLIGDLLDGNVLNDVLFVDFTLNTVQSAYPQLKPPRDLNAEPDGSWQKYRHAAVVRRGRAPLTLLDNCTSVVILFPTSHSTDDVLTSALVVLLRSEYLDFDQCHDDRLNGCNELQCEPIAGGGFVSGVGYECCCMHAAVCVSGAQIEARNASGGGNGTRAALCPADESNERSRPAAVVFMCINVFFTVASLLLVVLIVRQRKTQQFQQYGVRGWALMELCAVGATLLYLIVVVEFFRPSIMSCCLSVWLRELGFVLFYGSIVLKIYRNFVEYRVRKAHHVYVKEVDMLKYLVCMSALTVTGLLAWTLAQAHNSPSTAFLVTTVYAKHAGLPPLHLCRIPFWAYAWHLYEMIFLLWGLRLCYKARNSSWTEKWNFTIAVSVEICVTLIANMARMMFHFEREPGGVGAKPQTMQTISFLHVHSTVTIVICLVVAPKFYYVRRDPSRGSAGAGSGMGVSGKAHPSLAKLRDNLVNGTIDFAEVPIVDMNPEDIRAELKRVYTQLRMFKLKGQYQDNPHIITKRKKNKSDRKDVTSTGQSKQCATSLNNRQSQLTQHKNRNELYRVEEDEASWMLDSTATASPQTGAAAAFAMADDPPSCASTAADITVESSPHNVYLSSTNVAAHTNHYQLESDQSVRV